MPITVGSCNHGLLLVIEHFRGHYHQMSIDGGTEILWHLNLNKDVLQALSKFLRFQEGSFANIIWWSINHGKKIQKLYGPMNQYITSWQTFISTGTGKHLVPTWEEDLSKTQIYFQNAGSRNRKRKIIWFNPPFSRNIST